MSRIWKNPVVLPEGVTFALNWSEITIKGSKGELQFTHASTVKVEQNDKEVIVTPLNDDAKAMWGTTRSIINNMVIGVTEGYKKSLEINWVGYKFEVQGQKIILSIGYSHKVEMVVPTWIKAEMDEKLKNVLHITGIDKQFVGEFSAKVRAKKKPEPYKGKGIKYIDEYVRRKAGKTGAK